MKFSAKLAGRDLLCSRRVLFDPERSRKLFYSCMRITALFILALLISIQLLFALPSKGQHLKNVEVQLSLNHSSLIKALQSLEKKSPFRFVYRKDDLRNIEINQNIQGVLTVHDALQKILANSGLQFEQIDKSILISPVAKQISLAAHQGELKSVLIQIQEQFGMEIKVDANVLELAKPVNVDFANVDIHSAMEAVLQGQQLMYSIQHNRIEILPLTNGDVSIQNIKQEPVQQGKIFLMTEKGTIPGGGVTVQVKGTSKEIVANAKGEYSIEAKKGDVLVFRMLGYDRQEVIVSGQPINIILQFSMNNLDEVIITGFTTQTKREITGSISSIKAETIESQNIQSFDQAMQGRMSGVHVQSATGSPGGAVKVEIRGQGSISAGTSPIYVVDGVVVNSDDKGTLTSNNPLSFLNPKDIVSIEVLKDAAAASVYGAQAGNGVVLVTTKSGASGAVVYDVSLQRGYTSPTNLLALMNSQQWFQGRLESMLNRYPTRSDQLNRENMLKSANLPLTTTDSELAQIPTYDWQAETFRTGVSNLINFSASGGNDRSVFRISGGYENTEGSLVATDFMRGTLSMRYKQKLSEKLSFSTTVNLNRNLQNGTLNSYGAGTYINAPQYAALMTVPFAPIYNEDGSLYADYTKKYPGTFANNSIHYALLNDYYDKTTGVIANVQLDYQILKNLKYNTIVGLDYRLIEGKNYVDPRTQGGYATKGSITISSQVPQSISNTHTLTYNTTFLEDHHLTTLLGAEYRDYERQSSTTSGQGFPNFKFRELSSAALITGASSSWTGVRRLGSFLQANYSYKRKYMFSGILRYDGSSRFGVDKMFGWFPALSAGWDLSQENFLNHSKIDQLKIRIGYGETGNDQISNFASRSLFGGGITYNNESGIKPDALGNSRLRWERNSTSNLGIDFSFFKGRLYGSAEIFYRLSKDLLLSQPITWLSGYGAINQNVGEVVNKGVEFEVSFIPVKTRDFKWVSSFNISHIKNKVTKLYGDLVFLPSNNSVRVGYPLQTNFYSQYAGVNSATGKPFYYNHDGDITYRVDTQVETSFTPFGRGNRLSDYFGGFTNDFSYKGLTLSVFFQYDYGRELYNNLARILASGGASNSNSIEYYFLNRWTTPGQLTAVPRLVDGRSEVNATADNAASSRWLEDGSYIRLKQVNLSYDLPDFINRKLGMKGTRLFLQGQNLFTWTKWTGFDPEFYIDEDFTSNAGVVPPFKSMNFGFQFKF